MIELLLQKYSEPKTRLSQYELDSTTFILLHLYTVANILPIGSRQYEEVELRRQTPISGVNFFKIKLKFGLFFCPVNAKFCRAIHFSLTLPNVIRLSWAGSSW